MDTFQYNQAATWHLGGTFTTVVLLIMKIMIMMMGKGIMTLDLIIFQNPAIKSHGNPLALLFFYYFSDAYSSCLRASSLLVIWWESYHKHTASSDWESSLSFLGFMKLELHITPGEAPKDTALHLYLIIESSAILNVQSWSLLKLYCQYL